MTASGVLPSSDPGTWHPRPELLKGAHHSAVQLPSRSRCACVYTSSRGPPAMQVHTGLLRSRFMTSASPYCWKSLDVCSTVAAMCDVCHTSDRSDDCDAAEKGLWRHMLTHRARAGKRRLDRSVEAHDYSQSSRSRAAPAPPPPRLLPVAASMRASTSSLYTGAALPCTRS